jgi:tetratricopeptide (TPR) repeat protein
MTLFPVIAMTMMLAMGQAAPSAETAPGSAAAPRPAADRRDILKQTLADYSSAVAMKNRGGPDAQQSFRRALTGFQSLQREGGQNGRLFYNIANTYLQLGDIGRAIVNYRRALRLAPDDDRVRKNLQVARDLCQVRIPLPATSAIVETLFFWHFGTSLAARLKFALAAYAVFWILMLVRLFVLRGVPAFAWTIRVVGVIVLITGASVTWEIAAQQNQIEGVVVANEAALRKGNGDYYEPQLDRPLSAGVEFRVLESRQDVQGDSWYLVRLRDGKEGWLRADQADVI